jgi:hypothetical protein
MERFNLKMLNNVEIKEKYQENLHDNVDIIMAW